MFNGLTAKPMTGMNPLKLELSKPAHNVKLEIIPMKEDVVESLEEVMHTRANHEREKYLFNPSSSLGRRCQSEIEISPSTAEQA